MLTFSLHVVDVTHPNAAEQIEAVEDTLAELEVDHPPWSSPQ